MGNNLFDDLKQKFSDKHEEIKSEVVEKHKNALALITSYPTQVAAGLMGAVMVATSAVPAPPPHALSTIESSAITPATFVISDLQAAVPDSVRELTPEEEESISKILSRKFDMNASAELDGIRLNRSYGYIGQEQHLARYPGDSMATHFDNGEDAAKHGAQGMAPGLGAWGYFAPSKYDMTKEDSEKEKYYIAVQTFLAPGFHDNVRRYIQFFKHRKMLVVNPENGKAMVVVIGDAGPGSSTGKHLGGSPEVMKYLERVDGRQKGPVLYYFIDDPNDTIPLGPIQPK